MFADVYLAKYDHLKGITVDTKFIKWSGWRVIYDKEM